jgi:hypothetical protein
MKSQRRHELQQNVLDTELARGVEFVRTHRTALGWGLVIAVVAVFAIFYVVRHFGQKALEVQAQYERLTMDPEMTEQEQAEGFKAVSQDSNKHYAALALVRLGDLYARQLVGAAGMLAAQRDELADIAAGYYRRVIEGHQDRKQALAEAHLGMGKLQESRGELTAARSEYQSVLLMTELRGWPVRDQAEQAKQDLDSFKQPIRMATTSSAPATAPAAQRKGASQPAEAKAQQEGKPQRRS